MVTTLIGYKPPMTVLPPAIRWGCDNEPLAEEAYIAYMTAMGADVEVFECGLHLHNEHNCLCASSDGRIVVSSLDELCRGCLEIKCPFSVGGQSAVELRPLQIAQKYPLQSCLKVAADGKENCI